MPDRLAQVTDAAERKRDAERGYRDALHTAWLERLPVREIARAAGVTRQAVYKVLNRRDEA